MAVEHRRRTNCTLICCEESKQCFFAGHIARTRGSLSDKHALDPSASIPSALIFGRSSSVPILYYWDCISGRVEEFSSDYSIVRIDTDPGGFPHILNVSCTGRLQCKTPQGQSFCDRHANLILFRFAHMLCHSHTTAGHSSLCRRAKRYVRK